MFNKQLERRIERIEERISSMESKQMDFLMHAHDVLKTVTANDKKRFMYDLQQEDIELIEEGKKIRGIRKIVC